MTLSEFKAWFEGFTENLNGPPNKKQWARIQKRVGEITRDSVHIDHYITRDIRPYWHWNLTTMPILCGSSTADSVSMNSSNETTMNPTAACFTALGKADALQIEAMG